MVISKNSQLGLMWCDREMMTEFVRDSKEFLKKEKSVLVDTILASGEESFELGYAKNDGDKLYEEISAKIGYHPELKGSEFYTVKNPFPFYYLIQLSVFKCSELIRINENFSCSIFNKIKDGEHIYLLGKNEFFRFVKFNDAIRASYWSREKHIAFELGFHLEKDEYYFPISEKTEFNRLVRLMVFIELGDIEIIYLEKGKNNGKSKKDGKITNTSQYNVYVVDSSWNKIIIRTEGFAVRGHFRLQPCGHNMSERKLIWIDAFEKHGYKRRPKAEIINQ